jgi:hypothetical protein
MRKAHPCICIGLALVELLDVREHMWVMCAWVVVVEVHVTLNMSVFRGGMHHWSEQWSCSGHLLYQAPLECLDRAQRGTTRGGGG